MHHLERRVASLRRRQQHVVAVRINLRAGARRLDITGRPLVSAPALARVRLPDAVGTDATVAAQVRVDRAWQAVCGCTRVTIHPLETAGALAAVRPLPGVRAAAAVLAVGRRAGVVRRRGRCRRGRLHV